MEEVEIIITANSSPAVVGIEKVERALDDLEHKQGKYADASHKRATLSAADLKKERDDIQRATDISEKYEKQIQKLIKTEQTRRDNGERARGKGRFISEASQAQKVADQISRLEKKRQAEITATTGLTLRGYKERLAALRSMEVESERAAKAEEARVARIQKTRITAQQQWNTMLDKAFVENDRRSEASARSEEQRIKTIMQSRDVEMRNFTASNRERERQMVIIHARALKDHEDFLKQSEARSSKLETEAKKADGFWKRISSSGGGGVRRSQFSDNPIIDTGGRGFQPRTLGIGSLVGLAGVAAGPVLAGAGGLLGSIPGAAMGIGSAIAAIKAAGLGDIKSTFDKIQAVQDKITAGTIKQANGQKQINELMGKLSPTQQKGLKLFEGMRDVVHDIGKSAQDTLLPAFGDVGKALSADAPILARGVQAASTAIADLLTNMSKFVSSGPGKVLFAGTSSAGNTFILGLGKTLENLGKSFFGVGNASQDFMKKISSMTNAVTKSFSDWSTSKGGQAQLKDFFKVAGDEIPRIMGLFKDLGKLLFTIFSAALPYADRFIDSLRNILQDFNKFLKSGRGQSDMKELFNDLTGVIKGTVAIVKTLWPIFSNGFEAIEGGIKRLNSAFGPLGAAIGLTGIYFTTKLMAPASEALKEVAGKLAKLVVTNPWAAAIAGTIVLIGVLATAKTNLEQIKDKAADAAAQIRSVFDAITHKKLDKADLKVAGGNVESAKGTLGSALTKLTRDSNKRDSIVAKNGDATKITNQMAADQRAVDRARASLAHYKADYESLRGSIQDDNDKIEKGIDDTAKSVSDAFTRAFLHIKTQFAPGMMPKDWIDKKSLDNARTQISNVFSTMGYKADDAGNRTKLAMNWISDFVKKMGRVPTNKEIEVELKGLAKKSIQEILTLLGKVHDKNFKITADNVNKTMMDIKQVDDRKVADKHFSILGKLVNPTIPSYEDPLLPHTPTARPSTGGRIPGMGGHDSVPALLQPGEVVLNRRQQYDFGGPEVFNNYFGSSKSITRMAAGGIAGSLGARVIGDSPTSGLITNANGKVIGGVGLGERTPNNTSVANSSGTPVVTKATDSEPGFDKILAQLKGQNPKVRHWQEMVKQHQIEYDTIKENYLFNDYQRRSDLGIKMANLSGKKGKGATSARAEIKKQQGTLAKKILRDQKSLRFFSNELSQSKKMVRSSATVYSNIPGWDAYQGKLADWDGEEATLSYQAGLMPMLDPNADPNSPNGLNTLNNLWKKYNEDFNNAEAGERGTIGSRVDWLTGLIPSLGKTPKYATMAKQELVDDQNLMLAVLGKSLAETIPSGAGPGDTITSGGDDTSGATAWAENQTTKDYISRMASDAATAAYAQISNDPSGWLGAMTDEKNATWDRLQALLSYKDSPAYASWRDDILDEITSDSGSYGSITDAIAAGFSKSGNNGSDDLHLQDVVDAANAMMSEINVGTASERETLGILSSYLASQVPSYETGTSYVSRTGLAKVHQGEQITARGDRASNTAGGTMTLRGSDRLTKVLADHMSVDISYAQGQESRRRTRERRR